MSGPSHSAELLERIAAALGVPVEAFRAPPPDAAAFAAIAGLFFAPEGRRLAAAYMAMRPEDRAALLNVAQVIADLRAQRGAA